MAQEITQEHLKEILHYDPETGVFTWRECLSIRGRIGHRAGWTDKRGYVFIRAHGKLMSAHRLAWLYVHGYWPKGDIDHVDGNPSNNSLLNLREATRSENNQNRSKFGRGVTGLIGVGHNPKCTRNPFQAAIRVLGRRIYIGSFPTKEDAHRAYMQAKAELHTFNPKPRDYCKEK